jgi:hypothetical protein
MTHMVSGVWVAGTPLLSGLALLGIPEALRRDRALGTALLLLSAACGPAYFLATRFDLSEWVARSVLEPSFIPLLIAEGGFAAFGIAVLARWGWAPPVLAAALAGWGLMNRAADSHREDFSAYDYARDLRRSLPADAAVVAGGDTALFGLRWLEALEPGGPLIIGAREPDLRARIEAELPRRPVYVLGLPEAALGTLGLLGEAGFAAPAGLVQRIFPLAARRGAAEDAPGWSVSALRPGGLGGTDSYAHDIRLAYAFAHYLSGRLAERAGRNPSRDYVEASVLDPEDYRVDLAPSQDASALRSAR